MHYLICGGERGAFDVAESSRPRVVANGEMLVLEGPWPLASTSLAYVDNDQALAQFKAANSRGLAGFAVEGLQEPGAGEAFVLAAHKMLDPGGFKPYAEAIPSLLQRFGVQSLARGGLVTPLGGDFIPDRGVVLEFPTLESVVSFYTSEIYAPLLALRLRTTNPRFVVIARSGAIPTAVRQAAEDYLTSRPC